MPMKSPAVPREFLPAFLWAEVAVKTTEMLWSSGQVIGTRVDRMMRAGPSPSRRDQREFTRMGVEKIEAATASALAVATQLQTAPMTWLVPAWGWWQAWWQPAFSLWGAVPGTRKTTPRASAAHAQHVAADMARLTHAALEPIHAAAVGNARRLARVKSRRSGRR